MKHVVIVGAGGAGLCMLEQLLLCAKRPLRISMVDPDPESHRQRTWCRWLPKNDDSTYHSVLWPRIRFAAPTCDLLLTPSESTYAHVSGTDFHSHVLSLNDGRHQIEWIRQAATGFGYDGPGHAHVYLGLKRLTGDVVFTSWFPGQRMSPDLWQHFHGWVIETTAPVFDPETMTLMDFDVPQHPQGVVFGYVLPFEPTVALVELTCFSRKTWTMDEYERRLSDHILTTFQLEPGSYSIRSRETGQIPMSPIPNPGKPNPATFPIGTIAGAVKPSTGYAFARMQQSCQHLAETWLREGQARYPAQAPKRFAFYDALLLRIFRESPSSGIPIFRSLFSKVPVDLVFRFLDEKTTLRQEIGLFMRLPLTPFLKSLWRHVTS
jgi:lycopene beta-cyclase